MKPNTKKTEGKAMKKPTNKPQVKYEKTTFNLPSGGYGTYVEKKGEMGYLLVLVLIFLLVLLGWVRI